MQIYQVFFYLDAPDILLNIVLMRCVLVTCLFVFFSSLGILCLFSSSSVVVLQSLLIICCVFVFFLFLICLFAFHIQFFFQFWLLLSFCSIVTITEGPIAVAYFATLVCIFYVLCLLYLSSWNYLIWFDKRAIKHAPNPCLYLTNSKNFCINRFVRHWTPVVPSFDHYIKKKEGCRAPSGIVLHFLSLCLMQSSQRSEVLVLLQQKCLMIFSIAFVQDSQCLFRNNLN